MHLDAHRFLAPADIAKEALQKAIDVWMNKTCLKFVEWTDQSNYILIVEEHG